MSRRQALEALDIHVVGAGDFLARGVEEPRLQLGAAGRELHRENRRLIACGDGVPGVEAGHARRARFAQIRYPWTDVREALNAYASVTPAGQPIQLAYVNPETGEPCLPTLGFSAQQLRDGETITMPRRSASSVLHVIEGRGESEIDGVTIRWSEADTIAVPTHARVTHRASGGDAYFFVVDDAPAQRALGFYEDFE